MKHQQVSVDYWAMGKAMLTYGALTALGWLMLRLIGAVFSLPRRLRASQETMEATIKELQRRYPDLNITEEDLKNAEKEFEEMTRTKENYPDSSDNKGNAEKPEIVNNTEDKENSSEEQETVEDKKTI